MERCVTPTCRGVPPQLNSKDFFSLGFSPTRGNGHGPVPALLFESLITVSILSPPGSVAPGFSANSQASKIPNHY
jgi:hypothetical protein